MNGKLWMIRVIHARNRNLDGGVPFLSSGAVIRRPWAAVLIVNVVACNIRLGVLVPPKGTIKTKSNVGGKERRKQYEKGQKQLWKKSWKKRPGRCKKSVKHNYTFGTSIRAEFIQIGLTCKQQKLCKIILIKFMWKDMNRLCIFFS